MKNKFSLKKFFSRDITLLVTSVFIAFVIWFVINANSQVDGTKTIQNIPITIELSEDAVEDGLEVFGVDGQTASVDVTGNRMTVGSLGPDDIKIEAYQSNMIIAPDSYTLELSAKRNSVKTNYNFASNVKPSTITVFVDRRKEKEFAITDKVVYKVEEGYYANSSLSETVVTLSGPETEISAIEQVVIEGTLEGSVKETVTEKFDLVFLDVNGEKLDINLSTMSSTSVQVSLSALPTMEVELDVSRVNEPAAHPDIKISPSKIKIAAEQSVLDSIVDNKVSIGTLDFSSLSNKKNVVEYDITLPKGCKNLSDSTQAEIAVNMSNYDSKKLTIDDFKIENFDVNKYFVEFNSTSIDIKVCGPSSAIQMIKPSDVVCTVDFSEIDSGDFQDSSRATFEIPIKFEMSKGFTRCFVEGSYTIGVNISKL